MPKLPGVFSNFKNLDKIPVSEIVSHLRDKNEIHALENYIGNRLLYPQALPVTPIDLEIDLAILKAAATRDPQFFYNPLSSRLIIPGEFKNKFPNLFEVVKALLDAIRPEGIIAVFIKENNINKFYGSVVSSSLLYRPDLKDDSQILVNGVMVNLRPNEINILNQTDRHVKLKLPGQDEIMVSGGDLGILIDLRRPENAN